MTSHPIETCYCDTCCSARQALYGSRDALIKTVPMTSNASVDRIRAHIKNCSLGEKCPWAAVKPETIHREDEPMPGTITTIADLDKLREANATFADDDEKRAQLIERKHEMGKLSTDYVSRLTLLKIDADTRFTRQDFTRLAGVCETMAAHARTIARLTQISTIIQLKLDGALPFDTPETYQSDQAFLQSINLTDGPTRPGADADDVGR